MLRTTLALFVVIFTGLVVAGCRGFESSSETESSSKPKSDSATKDAKVSLLFALEFDSATISVSPDDPKRLTVKLSPASASIVWFTDRPVRRAGRMSLATFAERWPALFESDPPNAAIGTNDDGGSLLAITMLKPTVAADGTLTFEATVLDGFEETGPFAHLSKAISTATPKRINAGGLFIDPCLGAAVTQLVAED